MTAYMSWVFTLITVIILTACAPAQAPATPTLAPTYTALPSPTASATPIPTATSTPTLTPTLTPLPTSTPTKTPRPTPIPAANADAMIDWKKLNMPEGIKASNPKEMGIDKGERAYNFFIGDEEIIYYIEDSFFFSNKEEDNLIFGYTVALTTTNDLKYYDLLIDNQMELRRNGSESKEPGFKAAELPQEGMIGEKSAGVTASYKNTLSNGDLWHLDSIAFRTGNVGATVFLRYADETPSPITIDKLAQVYADSIQKDYHGCRLVSLKYVGSSPQMAFEYQAEGFYPNEPRFLVIEGDYQIGGKTEKFGAMAAGMTEDAPKTDSQGNIQETWVAGVISGKDVNISGDYQFSLGGWYSGCVITQTLTIPSP